MSHPSSILRDSVGETWSGSSVAGPEVTRNAAAVASECVVGVCVCGGLP